MQIKYFNDIYFKYVGTYNNKHYYYFVTSLTCIIYHSIYIKTSWESAHCERAEFPVSKRILNNNLKTLGTQQNE